MPEGKVPKQVTPVVISLSQEYAPKKRSFVEKASSILSCRRKTGLAITAGAGKEWVQVSGYQEFFINLGNHQPVATVSGTQKRKTKKVHVQKQMLKKNKRTSISSLNSSYLQSSGYVQVQPCAK